MFDECLASTLRLKLIAGTRLNQRHVPTKEVSPQHKARQITHLSMQISTTSTVSYVLSYIRRGVADGASESVGSPGFVCARRSGDLPSAECHFQLVWIAV